MLRSFKSSRQPPPPGPTDPRLCATGCGANSVRQCAYVDRRGRVCGTRWCADHIMEVEGVSYCRRHAGVAKGLLKASVDATDLPDIDNRAASLCEWMGNDLDGGIRAVMVLAQAMHPGSEIFAKPLHRVLQGVPRRGSWHRAWMLQDQTGPRWKVSVSVEEDRDYEVVIRVNSAEVERFVPPWIERGVRRRKTDMVQLTEGRQYVRHRVLNAIAEAAVRRDPVQELGSVLEKLAQSEEKVRETAERSRAVLDNVADGIITLDEHGIIESSNPSARRILGYIERELVGQPIRMIIGEEAEKKLVAELSRRSWLSPDPTADATQEVQALRADGYRFPIELTVSDMELGSRRLFIGTFRDISDRKAQTAAITFQALHDGLTGLPNRAHFSERLRAALQASAVSGSGFAVLLLDLDRFKEVNDTLGHDSGDNLLKQTAERLLKVVRETDVVARLGGDEFAVLAASADGVQNAIDVAQRILRAFDAPMVLDETVVQVEPSIGVALFPEHGADPEVLVRHADIAMYLAKRSKSGTCLYSTAHDDHSASRLALMAELKQGIQNGELRLMYQPKIDLRTNKLSSVEALVRWQHPRHGLLTPDSFIPLAEDSGLIQFLTEWVVTEARRQLIAWHQEGLEIGVAVNLSARNLHQPELLKKVADVVEKLEVPRGRLTLEITETVAMSPGANRVLQDLQAMGVRLSIDDFGTGYSSLAYLRSLPFAELKIDRSFVTDLATREDDLAIVRSTIDLGHNLELEVVAEGVADAEGYAMLAALGCDYGQGHYIGKPMSAADITRWQAPAASPTRVRIVEAAG